MSLAMKKSENKSKILCVTINGVRYQYPFDIKSVDGENADVINAQGGV
jgi:hypothetical protein